MWFTTETTFNALPSPAVEEDRASEKGKTRLAMPSSHQRDRTEHILVSTGGKPPYPNRGSLMDLLI